MFTKMLKLVFTGVLLLCLISLVSGKIQCVDQNGDPVDWYVVFKLPKIPESTNAAVSKGYGYMYISSNTLDQGWTWSSIGIQNSSSLLAKTLRPYYTDMQGTWILYNDKNPRYGNIGYLFLHDGHTKGVIGADKEGGFWLVHSVPKYPLSSKNSYEYPETGFVFGQSALCMTLTPESLDSVGNDLIYNDAWMYGGRIDSTIYDQYPGLVAAISKKQKPRKPWYKINDIKTKGGTTFKSFAKSKKFKKDLYNLVANELQTDLLVESWQNTLTPLKSSCSTNFKVLNVEEISIKDKNITYSSRKDHSKWAVGKQQPWTCIGDINRTKHQDKRGGGTVCIQNQQLWQQYQNLVNKLENC